ncbi:hypothetical protein [Desulfolucanica intricata]|uniref:hypothetical protein n=1 Tax=Desulfolucanica intricata TaxID=1285191 RepID=UPI000837387A|nr:hypothetical protein [Desulfolucanica intricata]
MVFSLISIVGVVVVVVFMALIVTGLKDKTDKGGEGLIKNVYIYLVLFATLMMTIGGSVGVFMAVADIVAPVPYHQTFEEFKHFGNEKSQSDTEINEEAKPSEEELKKQYDAMVLMEKERQADRAKNNLIKSFGWIIIPLPVFIYFQRRLVNKDI